MFQMLVISYSHLDLFKSSCKLAYYYKYYKRIKTDQSNIYAIQGSAVHAALEHGIVGGRLVSLPQLIKLYLEYYDKEFVKNFDGNRKNLLVMNKDCRGKPWQFVYEKFRNEGVQMLTNYYNINKNRVENIIGFEEKVDIWLSKPQDENKVKLFGFIDKLISVDVDTIKIIDYKTSSSTNNVAKPEENLQLQIYDFAAKKMFPGYENYIVELDFVKLNKKLTHQYEPDIHIKTEQKLKEMSDEIFETINLYKNGIIPEPKKGSSCVFCPYKKICPAHRK